MRMWVRVRCASSPFPPEMATARGSGRLNDVWKVMDAAWTPREHHHTLRRPALRFPKKQSGSERDTWSVSLGGRENSSRGITTQITIVFKIMKNANNNYVACNTHNLKLGLATAPGVRLTKLPARRVSGVPGGSGHAAPAGAPRPCLCAILISGAAQAARAARWLLGADNTTPRSCKENTHVRPGPGCRGVTGEGRGATRHCSVEARHGALEGDCNSTRCCRAVSVPLTRIPRYSREGGREQEGAAPGASMQRGSAPGFEYRAGARPFSTPVCCVCGVSA